MYIIYCILMTYIFRRSAAATFLTLNITLYSNILYLPGIMFAFRRTLPLPAAVNYFRILIRKSAVSI